MKEQIVIVENLDSFSLKDTFECGQCFRWVKQEDESYTGIFKNNVVNVKKEKNKIVFSGICEDTIMPIITEYFDLERDYTKIKKQLAKVDSNMKTSIMYGQGIRILNQDLWETIVSFIISANNNIPRIKGIIERMAKKYGDEILWRGKAYYTFPTPRQLVEASVEDYRNLGLGFRDIRLYETVHMILDQTIKLEELQNKKTEEIKEVLLQMSGVGPKVADCILLYSSLKRVEVFPIDVWVRRVMNDLYIQNEQEEKVKKEQIIALAKEKFGDIAGIAQQYLFYWRREGA